MLSFKNSKIILFDFYSSQGVIEVRITPQPNLRGPVFKQFLYEAQISEDASKFATVISTEAKDPEGDLVRYDIGKIISKPKLDSSNLDP